MHGFWAGRRSPVFGGLGGPGGREAPFKRWGGSRLTVWKMFSGRRGRRHTLNGVNEATPCPGRAAGPPDPPAGGRLPPPPPPATPQPRAGPKWGWGEGRGGCGGRQPPAPGGSGGRQPFRGKVLLDLYRQPYVGGHLKEIQCYSWSWTCICSSVTRLYLALF